MCCNCLNMFCLRFWLQEITTAMFIHVVTSVNKVFITDLTLDMVGSNQGDKAPNTCGIHNEAFFHKQIHICALHPVVKQGLQLRIIIIKVCSH